MLVPPDVAIVDVTVRICTVTLFVPGAIKLVYVVLFPFLCESTPRLSFCSDHEYSYPPDAVNSIASPFFMVTESGETDISEDADSVSQPVSATAIAKANTARIK